MPDFVPPEIRRKRIDDTKHQLRQVQERWDNRLILERESLFEAYLDGRICIGLVVKMGGGAFLDGASVTEDTNPMRGERASGILIYEFDSGLKRVTTKYDRSMLVEVIEFIECPKGKISSLVRLYRIDNKLAKVGTDLLFKSEIDGLYKFFPRFMHGEVGVSTIGISSHVADNFGHRVVKRASEVVNSVTDDNAKPVDGECAGGPEIKAEIASLRISIDEMSVTFRPQKALNPGLRVTDVLIGPLNL